MPLTPRQRAFLERQLGRALTAAELHIDVAAIDRALERAKDQLEQAIDREKRRAVRRMLRGQRLRLDVTGEMLAVLAALHREGRRQALREMRSMSAQPPHRFAVDPVEPRLAPSVQRLRDGLGRLTVRVEREAVAADIGGLAGEAVRRRLMRVAGARDAASRVVSGAFASGLAATFEDADALGLFDGWQYTAVLDAGTCQRCAALDGTTYPTWEAISAVLPGGGPNPLCFGDGRCRCRPVPTGAAHSGQTPPVTGGGAGDGGGGGTPPAPPAGGEPPEYDPGRIPGAERATIEAGKAEWLLADKHAHFFRDELGFTLEDADELARQLREKLPTVRGAAGKLYRSGNRAWIAILVVEGPSAAHDTTTFWELLPAGVPKFVSARAASSKDRVEFGL